MYGGLECLTIGAQELYLVTACLLKSQKLK